MLIHIFNTKIKFTDNNHNTWHTKVICQGCKFRLFVTTKILYQTIITLKCTKYSNFLGDLAEANDARYSGCDFITTLIILNKIQKSCTITNIHQWRSLRGVMHCRGLGRPEGESYSI